MDYASIGRHCEIKECKQLDFLPIRCNLCESFFCAEHRNWEAHNCKKRRRVDQNVKDLSWLDDLPVSELKVFAADLNVRFTPQIEKRDLLLLLKQKLQSVEQVGTTN